MLDVCRLSVCVYILPFVWATTDPFVLKFGTAVDNTVGHQAKHFGASQVNTFPVILSLVTKNFKFYSIRKYWEYS